MRQTLTLVLILTCSTIAQAQEPCVPTPTFGSQVTLTWEPPLPQAGISVTGYVLERRTDEGSWVILPAPPPSATTATDTVTPGHTYVYQLRAQGTDSTGNVALSLPAAYGTPPPCVTVRGQEAPTQFRLRAQ